MREKLIEALEAAHNAVPREFIDDETKTVRDCIAAEADHLLANGVIVPPCKVGDTVYAAEVNPVIPLRVTEIAVYLEGADGGDFETVDNIGKTVFLTREEAEAALKEGQECEID